MHWHVESTPYNHHSENWLSCVKVLRKSSTSVTNLSKMGSLYTLVYFYIVLVMLEIFGKQYRVDPESDLNQYSHLLLMSSLLGPLCTLLSPNYLISVAKVQSDNAWKYQRHENTLRIPAMTNVLSVYWALVQPSTLNTHTYQFCA